MRPDDSHFLKFGDAPASFYRYGVEMDVPQNTVLIAANEIPQGCYYVIDGLAQAVYRDNSDNLDEIIVQLEPKSCFGEADVLLEVPSRYYFETIAPSKLLYLDRAAMIRAIEEDSEAAFFFLYSISLKMRLFQTNFENFSHGSSMHLTCQVLLDIARRYGVDEHNGRVRIDYDLSQEYLAQRTGLTRITISKNLKRLKEKDLLVKEGSTYYLTNYEAVEAFMNLFS